MSFILNLFLTKPTRFTASSTGWRRRFATNYGVGGTVLTGIRREGNERKRPERERSITS